MKMERFKAAVTKNYIWVIKIVILIVAAVLAGLITECLLNYKVWSLPKEKQGVHEIALDALEFEGFEQKDGQWVLGKDGGRVNGRFEQGYVHKLAYTYEYQGRIETTVSVYIGAEPNESLLFQIPDRNNVVLQGSVVNIGQEASRIEISFPAEASGLIFTGFQIQNQTYFNEMCFFFAVGFVLSIGCLFFLRKVSYGHPEWVFLAIASISGILLLICMPTQHISWDEEIHFGNSYEMSWSPSVGRSGLIEAYENISWENYPYDYPLSYEEQVMQDTYLDENGIYDKELLKKDEIVSGSLPGASAPGYFGSSLGLFLGRLLHLPFSDLFVMGRAFNFVVYVVLMFFAIRHLAFGKHILTIIGLMPTPIFLGTVYSYDAAVTGLVALGFSYLISEFARPEVEIKWKDYFIYVVSFLLAGCIKAVYFPLILLGLFLPKDKFASKKERYVMKIGIFGICVLLLAIFILPSLIAPSQGGDPRGGNTSVSGQLDYILGNPIGYMLLLMKSIVNNFFEYMMGSSSLSAIAYLGTFSASSFIAALLVFVILTDTNYEVAELKIWHRGLLLLVVGGIICLIWSALYLSFTPVGQQSIVGVQARYYIPIMLPFYLVFHSKRIVNKINPVCYTCVIYGCSIYLFYRVVFEQVIQQCCM